MSARNLLQAFDQVEIAQSAVEAVDVRLSIWCCLNRSDGGDAGGVNWDNLLPNSFLARGQVQLVNLRRHFTGAIEINGTPVLVPDDGDVSRVQAVNDARIAARSGIEVALLVGAGSHHQLAVRRNRKRRGIDPFWGNRLRSSA